MLLSLNWLRDYLQKAEVKINPGELAERLTMRGLAVESVKHFSQGLDNVVVGQIVKIEPHPDADRLQVTEVIFSKRREENPTIIVCGAKNIAEGDIVPVALPGAELPGDLIIKKSKIRGVESFGMICSGKELGMSDDHEGILQLPKHAKLGEPVARLLGNSKEDTILEFELTPNRGDCLSVFGLAREIAPLLKTKVREARAIRFRSSPHRTSSIIKVEVDDPENCPRYVARVLDSLKVQESPDWIKERLESVGIRPINNIVDITNFVMLETGQPLHAFDLRKISSGTLNVAACKEPMDFISLTGETYRLEPGDILIKDGDSPVALAGIIGGANSAIAEDTTSIILESAAFPASQIRMTAKRLGIITDSSKRFEKGTDLSCVSFASERAASLLRDSFDANVYHPPIDTNSEVPKERVICLDMRDVRRTLGLHKMTAEQAADLLTSIGITSRKRSVNILSVRLPMFRIDLFESIDLIEEVARLHGYDAIPLTYPQTPSAYDQLPEHHGNFERTAKEMLVNLGFRETIHYSFTSESTLEKYGYMQEDAMVLKNPISEEMRVMRTSLLPSLVETLAYNFNRKIESCKLFEVAKIYASDEQSETKSKETPYAAGLISGNLIEDAWNLEAMQVNFFHIKGVVEALVRKLTTVYLAFEPIVDSKIFHPKRSAALKLGLKTVGYAGELHPHLRQSMFGDATPVVMFELNLEGIRKYERSAIRFKTPTKFPSMDFDLAVLVDRNIACQTITDSIKHVGGELLSNVELFDVYDGKNLPDEKRSLAFHLSFLSSERTLQESEVTELKENIIRTLSEKYNAQLR